MLAEKIHDNRFLRLVRNMLHGRIPGGLDLERHAAAARRKAGSCPRSCPTSTCTGWTSSSRRFSSRNTPEAGAGHATRTTARWNRRSRGPARRGDRAEVRALRTAAAQPAQPGSRRSRLPAAALRRYADDTLLGFAGPKAEAEEIKQRLAAFLRDDLKLELSQDKTLITHARTRRGEVPRLRDHRPARPRPTSVTDGATAIGQRHGRACACPRSVIKAKMRPLPVSAANPRAGTRLVNDDDYTIVSTYGAEYRGIVQYYLLAGDVCRLNRLRWVMETSMLKTLAGKHRSSVSKMAARYKAKIDDTARAAHVLRGQRRTREAGSHWSHGSAAFRSSGRRRRSSPTVVTPARSPAARS